jgi:hypothetical protein
VAVTQRVQQDGQWRDGDTSFFKVNAFFLVAASNATAGLRFYEVNRSRAL